VNPLVSSRLAIGGLLIAVGALSLQADDHDDEQTQSQLADDEPPHIEVWGQRWHPFRQDQAGRQRLVLPDDLSSWDIQTHLKQDSSFLLKPTGHLSSTGYSVPRIRGQDSQLTDIYLETIRLFDPYTGLPLAAELDLRAFGAVEITKGLAATQVSSVNPVGGLRYRYLPLMEPQQTTVGVDVGRPFGLSLWGLWRGRQESATNTDYSETRIFTRWHKTDGEYSYYDDAATPYNKADDAIRQRRQNGRRSFQIMPVYRLEQDNQAWTIVGWWQTIDQEQPSLNQLRPSQARQQTAFGLGAVAWERELAPMGGWLPSLLTAQVRVSRENRRFEDPTQVFLGDASQQRMQVLAGEGLLGLEWQQQSLPSYYHRLEMSWGENRTEIRDDADLDLELTRSQQRLYLGGWQQLADRWRWNYKLLTELQRDGFPKQGIDQVRAWGEQSQRQRRSLGWSLGFHYEPVAALEFYAQAGVYERLPTLLEEFGNGGRVAGNPNLQPESVEHRELGAVWGQTGGQWQLELAFFADQMQDKIVFIPKFENASVATNLAKTAIRGIEFAGQTRWSSWLAGLSATWLEPLDLTVPGQRYLIPGIPRQLISLHTSLYIEDWTLRVAARQQGRVYRDRLNSKQVPPARIIDAALDYHWSTEWGNWQVGLRAENLTDVTSIPVATQGGEVAQQGRLPYSSLTGQPLPGRHFKGMIAIDF
jgi:hypothetical protein